MTKPIKIVTDSSVQLTPEEIKENNITVIPLSVEVNGKNYIDGEDISREQLVEELRKGNIPKTSQPAMGRFIDTFDELGKDGSQVLAILISDVLSGTFETALSAADMSEADVIFKLISFVKAPAKRLTRPPATRQSRLSTNTSIVVRE